MTLDTPSCNRITMVQLDTGNLKVAEQTFIQARRLLDEIEALEETVGPKLR